MADELPADDRVLGTRYRLRELIGRGGTAAVHRAWDDLLHRDVAVKVFDTRAAPDLAQQQRRLTEMQALAAVDHPGLVAVYDAMVADPAEPTASTYLVMELVPGTTLAERLTSGPVPETLTRAWGMMLAGALANVHAVGLVHRDVKPANVLLGPADTVKLGDFGLARVLHADARITPGPDVLGTPAYLSPEQAASNPVGPRSDVYSLGLVLLECLTGRREYPGEAVSSALARLLRSPAVPDDLPAPWTPLLRSMTAREPERRPDAAAVAAALAATVTPSEATMPDDDGTAFPIWRVAGAPAANARAAVSPALAGRRRSRGRRMLVASALVTAAGAAVFGVAGVVGGQGGSDESTPAARIPVSGPPQLPATATGSSEASRPEPSSSEPVAPTAEARESAESPVSAQPAPEETQAEPQDDEPAATLEPAPTAQPAPVAEQLVVSRPDADPIPEEPAPAAASAGVQPDPPAVPPAPAPAAAPAPTPAPAPVDVAPVEPTGGDANGNGENADGGAGNGVDASAPGDGDAGNGNAGGNSGSNAGGNGNGGNNSVDNKDKEKNKNKDKPKNRG